LPGSLPYDYLKVYLLMSQEKVADARALADHYRDYPVDRWRNLFQDVLAQLDELEGKGAKVVDKADRGQLQTQLADTEAGFDVKVENRAITIHYQNLTSCRVNYYPMDLEQLFLAERIRTGGLRAVFAGDPAQRFRGRSRCRKARTRSSWICPRRTTRTGNVNDRSDGWRRGQSRSRTTRTRSASRCSRTTARLKVLHDQTGKPLAKVLCSRSTPVSKDGSVRFYKDGYTDLRGRFRNYSSLKHR